MRKLIAGSTAAAFLACSTIAHAAPVATSGPIEDVRIGAPVDASESMGGGVGLISAVAVVALLVWLLMINKDGDDDIPRSA